MIKYKKWIGAFYAILFIFSMALPLMNPTPTHAVGWYDTDWSYRRLITIDQTKVDTADLTDFPVLVKLVDGTNFTAANAMANGYDIRFTQNDGTTLLKYERELHTNAAGGSSYYWVKIPTVEYDADTTFYVYYGHSDAADGADANAVWNSGYEAVWHMNDLTTSSVNDSTDHNKDGAKAGANAPIETATGKIGKGQDFDEDADYIDITLDYGTTYTVEVWIMPEDTTLALGGIGGGKTNTTTSSSAFMCWRNTHYLNAWSNILNTGVATAAGTAVDDGSWYYMAYAVTLKENYLYRNDDAAVHLDDGANDVTDTSHTFGRWIYTSTYYFDGKMDEIRVSSVKRTAEWIKASYYSGNDNLLSVGAETGQVPILTTTANATSIEETSATLSGNITDVGAAGAEVTTRGFEYDTNSGAPYASDIHEHGSWNTDGTAYSLSPTLTEGELYFFRSYATNGAGTGYGSEYTLQTKPDPPTALTATMAAGDNIDLAWTKGDGADTTYIRGKLGSAPVDRTDGTYSWSGTSANVTHAAATPDQHWYYIAWSSSTHSGYYTTLSDTPDASANAWTSAQMTGYTKSAGRGRDWATFEVELSSSSAGEIFNKVDINYGVTTAYGATVSRTGLWNSGDKVLLTARGLNPATAYHFQAVVYETLGTHAHTADDTFATLGSPSMFEYLSTGGDGDSGRIASANWTYEVFTSDDVAHMVTSVDLQLKRVGLPSTVTVSIRDANAGGTEPTGEDLTSITMDGDTLSTSYGWYKFTFTTIKSLEANHYYAIVVRALDGDYTSNYVLWQKDTGGGLAGAINGDSANGGISWTAGSGDQLFQVWGYPSLQVLNAKVFTGYITTGDWLLVAETENTYPPYYNDNADPSVYFYLQLVDVATGKTEAAVPCRAWARQPLGIYISKSVADTLSWSGNYTARMYYSEAGDYQEYPLSSSDWRGTDLTYLDQWMRVTAASMQDYYGVTLMTTDLSKSIYSILNSEGGILFTRGIPAITEVRPDMFSDVGGAATPHTEKDFTKTYENTRNWQNSFGGGITNTVYSIAEAMGVDTTDTDKLNTLVGFFWIIAYVILLMLVGADRIDGWASIALAIPFVLVGAYGGAVDMSYLFGVILFAVAIRIFNWIQP